MAGTRLLVHTTFLLEFLVLVVLAAYFGLIRRQDLLSVPLMQQQGRSLLQSVPVILSEPLSTPAVTLAVSKGQQTHWESLVGKLKLASHNVKVLDADDHMNVCEDPNSKYDLVICEENSDRSRLVIHNKTTVLYHNSVAAHESLLFPNKASRKELQLTLLVDQDTYDWKIYTEAINRWMDERHLSAWPCLLGPPKVNLKVVDFKAEPAANEKNQTFYRLDTRQIDQYLQHSRKGTLHAFLYVPSETSVLAVDTDGKAYSVMATETELFTIVPKATGDDDSFDVALERVVDMISSECMGVPKDLISLTESKTDDSSFPQWFLKLWYQDILQDTYRQVVKATLKERSLLLNTPRTVPINENVAIRWMKAVEWIEIARNSTRIGDYESALWKLDLAMKQIEELQKDPALLEPLDFPWDQYAAIFAPLLLPLLLPLLTGLVREIKRYRQLKARKE